MSTLSAFLEPQYTEETAEVVIGDRFVDRETGNVVPFKIKTLTQDEISKIRNRSMVTKSVDGRKYQEIDNDIFLCRCLVEACIVPDLKSEAICTRYSPDNETPIKPWEVPHKMLLGREFEQLGRAFMKLNGINEDSPELGVISKN